MLKGVVFNILIQDYFLGQKNSFLILFI